MFVIVGCNHGIQVGIGGFAALDDRIQNEQRGHFREMLEDICVDRRIQLVLEENGDVEETTAKQIADRREIPWFDVNTTNEEKDRLGIPRDYVICDYTQEQKDQWHRMREEVMLGKIKQSVRACECKFALVVCGFEHTSQLAELLERDGAAVEPVDYRERAWYQAGAFQGEY